MRISFRTTLGLSLLLVGGCRDYEAIRFHPLNPERFRHPSEWEKEKREFLAKHRNHEQPQTGRTGRTAFRETAAGNVAGNERSQKEEPSALVLSLPEAVEYALGHNPDVVTARLEKTKAEGRITAARAGAFPSLSLSGSYIRQDEAPTIEVAPGTSIQIGELNNYRAGLNLVQPIYVGGRVRGALRVARDFKAMTASSYEAAELGVRFQTVKAYYELLLAEKQTRTMEEQLRLARSHLSDAENRYREGAALKFHVIRARSAMRLAESGLISARNSLETARRDLLLTIGAPVDSPLTLSDTLPEAADGGLPEPPREEILCLLRPEIAALESQIAMQRENIGIVKGGLRPTISAFADYVWENPPSKSFGETGWDDYWQAGIQLSWNLFDGGNVRGRLIEERAALRQMQHKLSNMLQSVHKEILDAIANIESTRRLVRARNNALLESREALRLAQAAYEAGTATQVELLDAQTALTSAELGYSEALLANALAWAAYRVSTGNSPLPERSN